MHNRPLDELIATSPTMDWLSNAACGDLPPDQLDLFFVEAGRTISSRAVAMCSACPVQGDCLDHAYRHQVASGYFGGMSPSKRRSSTHAAARETLGLPPSPDPTPELRPA